MAYGNSKRLSGATGCYCSQLVDSTCDFCSGLRMVPTPRYTVYENNEGTVIAIDGHPIQFSMLLTDSQIAKYLTSRAEQQVRCERTTEQVWLAND